MFKFRKKNEKIASERDNELHKTMDEHLELIRKNQELLNGLLDDISDINTNILAHKDAIMKLQYNINEVQELIRNSKEEIS